MFARLMVKLQKENPTEWTPPPSRGAEGPIYRAWRRAAKADKAMLEEVLEYAFEKMEIDLEFLPIREAIEEERQRAN
jgi:hypothetical protein